MTSPGIFILLSLVMTSDLARDVHYNYADHVEFPAHHSYSRLTIKGAALLVQLAEWLRVALEAQVRRTGLVSIGGNANSILTSRAAVIDRVTGYASGPDARLNYCSGWRYRGCLDSTTTGQAMTLQESPEKTVATLLNTYPPAVKTNSSG